MATHISVSVELNDGSGRRLLQVVEAPDIDTADSYGQDRMNEWVTEYARSMVLLDWNWVHRT